ncbi:hypothetical protein R1flu_000451 [Riccia fluitans]|uniref:Uncharacterized protein n=1 Tax=Riccia fluitans TaxID=41844 RepID=A0ABD1XZW3_9MARC
MHTARSGRAIAATNEVERVQAGMSNIDGAATEEYEQVLDSQAEEVNRITATEHESIPVVVHAITLKQLRYN